ncbi:MAG: histidine kinase [Defluviitaleaceae bacterium]|nr:histidine kinase [Defluviitaleaceae bacterium]
MLGFGLLIALWLIDGEMAGFFLLLFLLIMSLVRARFSRTEFTVVIDIIACLIFISLWEHAQFALGFALFSSMYFRVHFAIAAMAVYFFIDFNPLILMLNCMMILSGTFLGFWEKERLKQHKKLDETTGKYYELENLQQDLNGALEQVERMTAVAERARISRDVHDNAGHEIVAAYISLQTARQMLEGTDEDVLELYDAALERLNSGANKMREAVHNLAVTTAYGIENLDEICRNFPFCKANFKSHGDASKVPMYAWVVLEAILSESLTNVTRHSKASWVSVELDTTPHIVRLCIENDGVGESRKPAGSGLFNLRGRAKAAGGTLSVHSGDTFRIICVIPIRRDENEIINS